MTQPRSILHLIRPATEPSNPTSNNVANSSNSTDSQMLLRMIRTSHIPPQATAPQPVQSELPAMSPPINMQHEQPVFPGPPVGGYPYYYYPPPVPLLDPGLSSPYGYTYAPPVVNMASPQVCPPNPTEQPPRPQERAPLEKQLPSVSAADQFLISLQKSKSPLSLQQPQSSPSAASQSSSSTKAMATRRKSSNNPIKPLPPSPPPSLPLSATTAELNHIVMTRHDPALTKINLTSSHAVLYKFVPDTSAWEKLPCQGVLFIYTRSKESDYDDDVEDEGEQEHVLAILNRHGIKNFMVSLEEVTNIERLDEFVMLRTPAGAVEPWDLSYEDSTQPRQADVWGIWIYTDEDRATVEELCRRHVSPDDTADNMDQADDEPENFSLSPFVQQRPGGNADVLSSLFERAVNLYVKEQDTRPKKKNHKR
ncbi:uncharacterized protein V1518DRAFT_415322 [Limtongia smithiae]|uniref:uncharacterized protein n=1 Tax=Limtongia smithiae TaxID=1125753 RepID=UPI0034CD76A1